MHACIYEYVYVLSVSFVMVTLFTFLKLVTPCTDNTRAVDPRAEEEEVRYLERLMVEDDDVEAAALDITPYLDRLHTSLLAPTPPTGTANTSTHTQGKQKKK